MSSYHHNRRADEQLASAIAEARKGQTMCDLTDHAPLEKRNREGKIQYHYFVSGHTYFVEKQSAGQDPLPVNISTVIALPHAILDDGVLDKLTEEVKQRLDHEAEQNGFEQESFPTIRQVNLLHRTIDGVVTG